MKQRGGGLIVLYSRISMEDREKKEEKDASNSIVNQQNLLRSYVESRPEFAGRNVAELSDDGYSGTSLERPAMKRLLNMVKKGEVDCIIVKDFSRFGRDYLTVSDYIDQIFPFMGIRFISVGDHYDSAECKGATSGVDVAFRNVLYGYYSQDLSVKVRSGKHVKAENGDYIVPFAPIGYRKSREDKKKLEIEPEGAAIVRQIFRMAGEGLNCQQIAKRLNSERIPTPSQIKRRQGQNHKWWDGPGKMELWSRSTVRTIIRDERYLGKNVYGKRTRPVVGNRHTKSVDEEEWIVVDNCHEPLISEEEFKAVNERIRRGRAAKKGQPSGGLFLGKVRCASCGYCLVRLKVPTPRYYCVTRERLEACSCMRGSLNESELAEAVLAAIQMYVRVLLDGQAMGKETEDSAGIPGLKKELASLRNGIRGLRERKLQLYEQMADGKISKKEYQNWQEKLSCKQEADERECGRLEEQLRKLKYLADMGEEQGKQWRSYLNMEALTREMVEELIECIYVNPDKSIHIQWKFDGKLAG